MVVGYTNGQKTKNFVTCVNFDAPGLSPLKRNKEITWYKFARLFLVDPAPNKYSIRTWWANELLTELQSIGINLFGDSERKPRNLLIKMLNPYEKEINQYKDFYKTYLWQIFNKKLVIEDLMSVLPSYHGTPYFSGITGMSEKTHGIIYDTELILKKHFSEDYIKLFNKSIDYRPAKNTNTISRSLGDNLFINILSSFKYVMDQNIDKTKREWEYKKQFLNYTYNCLVSGGLHPKISERNEQRFKKINFVVIHKHMSRKEVTDYKSLIPWKEFHDQYLKFYNNRKPIKMN